MPLGNYQASQRHDGEKQLRTNKTEREWGMSEAEYESPIQCYCDKSQYDTSTNQ